MTSLVRNTLHSGSKILFAGLQQTQRFPSTLPTILGAWQRGIVLSTDKRERVISPLESSSQHSPLTQGAQTAESLQKLEEQVAALRAEVKQLKALMQNLSSIPGEMQSIHSLLTRMTKG